MWFAAVIAMLGENVAVIGGGIAGATIIDELLLRSHTVTLYEQNADLMASTSASITATVNLERFERDFFALGLEDIDDAFAYLGSAHQAGARVDSWTWAAFLTHAIAARFSPVVDIDHQKAFYAHSYKKLRDFEARHSALTAVYVGKNASLLKLYNSAACNPLLNGLRDSDDYNFTAVADWDMFIDSDTVACVVRPSAKAGFVQTSVLFEYLSSFLENQEGVLLEYGHLVTKITNNGDVTFTNASGEFSANYDKVFVAASVNSSVLVSEFNPNLGEFLLAFLGWGQTCAASTNTQIWDDTLHSVKFEGRAADKRFAYMRAMPDDASNVLMWGGASPATVMTADAPTNEEYSHLAEGVCTKPISEVRRGIRPVSASHVPILHSYGDASKIFLATGYSYWGYDLAWASASCIVSKAYDVRLLGVCKTAVQHDPILLAAWQILLIIIVVLASVIACIVLSFD